MNQFVTLAQLTAFREAIAPMCDGDEDLLQDMADGQTDIGWYIRRLHEQIARDEEMLVGIKERQEAIKDRKARIEARRDRMKAEVGNALRAAGLTKWELPEATYSVRNGKAKLEIVNADAVPEEFQRASYAPDKSAINEAFADADELPNWLVRDEARDVVTARTR